MNINATLIAQILAFLILIWMVNRLMWGPMINALEERRKRIADGLAAAEDSKKGLAKAQAEAVQMKREAQTQAADIIATSEKRAQEIVAEAKTAAREEGERIKVAAQSEIARELERAKEQLSQRVAELAVAGAERILAKEIDRNTHAVALKELEGKI